MVSEVGPQHDWPILFGSAELSRRVESARSGLSGGSSVPEDWSLAAALDARAGTSVTRRISSMSRNAPEASPSFATARYRPTLASGISREGAR